MLSSPSPPERVEELAAVQPVEVLRARANAIIRNGPSTKAKKIGAVTHGTALQVKAREGGWVQFVNSSSGVEGWIHSSLVGLTPESGTTSSAITRADAPASIPPRPKVAKKRIKQKPSASIQASKHRHYRPDPPVPIRSPSGFFSRRGGMTLGPSGDDLSSHRSSRIRLYQRTITLALQRVLCRMISGTVLPAFS